MLPEAQVAFLDEVFQGSSAILNSLLTLINERVFHNGAVKQIVPLISMIGASNIVPDDPSLRAFADRFVLRLELQKVADDRVDDLLEQGWDLESTRVKSAAQANAGQPQSKVSVGVRSEDVLALHSRLLEVDISKVRVEHGKLIRELRAEGIDLSDRRAIKGLKLIAGAALLREADVASVQDMWPLLYMWSRPEEADVIKSVLQPRLADASGGTLDVTRLIPDILADLNTIQTQEPLITSEAAMGAHLMALNKLRRELINDHPRDTEARKKVEEVIQRALKKMEGPHV
jgi:MoxR-like ATPase